MITKKLTLKHRSCKVGKLFELLCIENDFSRYFPKCCSLFKYFVAHMIIIARNDESNQIWPQGKSNLKNKINEIFFLFTLPSEIIWSLITFNIKQLLKKDYLLGKTVCLHSLKFRRQENLKCQENFDKSFSFIRGLHAWAEKVCYCTRTRPQKPHQKYTCKTSHA